MNDKQLLEMIGRGLRLAHVELKKIAASAPFRYKHYRLPKRSGGYRDIYHPTPELKAIQWWLVSNIICELPVHKAVFSYRLKTGIRDHAAIHVGSRYFLRFDFVDFFPSIKYWDIHRLLIAAASDKRIDMDETAISLLGRLVCRAPKGKKTSEDTLALGIGAPSSPSLSNAILFSLDSTLFELSADRDVIYTRYADDLYFSTRHPRVLSKLAGEVTRTIAAQQSPRLIINEAKTSSVSKKHRVQITGVVLTPSGDLSVGRTRKRFVRAQVHKYLLGRLDPGEIASLRGMIAFIRSVEPAFIERLTTKYSADRLVDIL